MDFFVLFVFYSLGTLLVLLERFIVDQDSLVGRLAVKNFHISMQLLNAILFTFCCLFLIPMALRICMFLFVKRHFHTRRNLSETG